MIPHKAPRGYRAFPGGDRQPVGEALEAPHSRPVAEDHALTKEGRKKVTQAT